MEQCPKCNAALPDGAVFCHMCGKKLSAPERKHRKRANGTGGISKLSGGRKKPWMARKNGVVIGTYATYKEAQRALELLVDANVTDKFNLTFQQVYELWKEEHDREISASQRQCYTSAYKNCTALHDQQFRKLRASDFQKAVTALEDAGKSKSTCEKVCQLFGQLSKWAIQEEITSTNYAQFVTVRAQQKSTRMPFSAEDINNIRASDLPAAQIALILIGSGCRPGELFEVPLVNCESNYFVGGSKTQAGRNRIIAIGPIGLSAYQKLLQKARAGKCHRLIDAYDGNRTTANFTKRDFADLMKSIGKEGMLPYNCRHTFATLAVQKGVEPALLKRMMGHADISTTDKFYTHLQKNDIINAVSVIDEKIAVCNKSVTNEKPA